jgi:hypothetical protein
MYGFLSLRDKRHVHSRLDEAGLTEEWLRLDRLPATAQPLFLPLTAAPPFLSD